MDTKFSASEAADAINNLAMAGYSVDEIYEAVPDVLNLAAAGNLSLDDAARMVTNSLGAMGLQTKDAAHLTDPEAAVHAPFLQRDVNGGEDLIRNPSGPHEPVGKE